MIASRGINLLRLICQNVKHKQMVLDNQSIRLSSSEAISYRKGSPPLKQRVYLANAMGGLVWWWIFWHFWHDFGHIVGEFDYPDPSKWTDEELGIPPEDSGLEIQI